MVQERREKKERESGGGVMRSNKNGNRNTRNGESAPSDVYLVVVVWERSRDRIYQRYN